MVVADPFHLSSDRSVYLWVLDPVSGLALLLIFILVLILILILLILLVFQHFLRVPNYTVFHDLQDCYAVTFYRHPQLLHNLFTSLKSTPYYGKYVPISFYPFLFCWQNHIAPWHPETFVAVRAYFPNCTWILQT